MKYNEKISIVVPAFNSESVLENCINSIIRQSYKNLEIIIINDGSTDNTKKIAEKLAKDDKRILIFNQNNEGVTAARMKGISISSGDFLMFCDSDDYFESDICEILLNSANKYKVDIAQCGYIRRENNLKKIVVGSKNTIMLNKEQAIKYLLTGGLFTGALWGKIYRKNLFDNIIIPFHLKMNEDLLFNYYLFKKASLSVYVSCAKYNYVVTQNSSCNKMNIAKKNKDVLEVAEIIYKDAQGSKYEEYALERYLRFLIGEFRQKYNKDENVNLEEKRNKILSVIKGKKINNAKLKLSTLMIQYMPLFYNMIFEIYNKLRKPKWDI